ncbi:MAG: glycosyltransferase family 2 protein [Candidatus Uhrbacteria bacterium]
MEENVKKISLIIPSFNTREILKNNLESLFKLTCRFPFEVIVVENGSSDGSAKMVHEEFPQIELIQNDWNSGFAHASNQGLRIARGEVLILLNADMVVKEGTLEKVFETLNERKEIGVLGVKLLKADNSILPSVRRDPDFWSQLAILLKLPHFFPKIVDNYLFKDFDYQKSAEVEQVRGSFFAFRRDVLDKVGFLDEKNFFFWFEEVDFCRRVRQTGLKVWYEASVSCLDLIGQSVKKVSFRKKQAMFSRSLTNYFFKWQPWWQGTVFFCLRPLVIILGFFADLWPR